MRSNSGYNAAGERQILGTGSRMSRGNTGACAAASNEHSCQFHVPSVQHALRSVDIEPLQPQSPPQTDAMNGCDLVVDAAR